MTAIEFFALYSLAMMVIGVGLILIAAGVNTRSRMLGLLILVGGCLGAFFMGHPIVRLLP